MGPTKGKHMKTNFDHIMLTKLAPVEDQVSDQIRPQVGKRVDYQIGDQLHDQLWEQLQYQVWSIYDY